MSADSAQDSQSYHSPSSLSQELEHATAPPGPTVLIHVSAPSTVTRDDRIHRRNANLISGFEAANRIRVYGTGDGAGDEEGDKVAEERKSSLISPSGVRRATSAPSLLEGEMNAEGTLEIAPGVNTSRANPNDSPALEAPEAPDSRSQGVSASDLSRAFHFTSGEESTQRHSAPPETPSQGLSRARPLQDPAKHRFRMKLARDMLVDVEIAASLVDHESPTGPSPSLGPPNAPEPPSPAIPDLGTSFGGSARSTRSRQAASGRPSHLQTYDPRDTPPSAQPLYDHRTSGPGNSTPARSQPSRSFRAGLASAESSFYGATPGFERELGNVDLGGSFYARASTAPAMVDSFGLTQGAEEELRAQAEARSFDTLPSEIPETLEEAPVTGDEGAEDEEFNFIGRGSYKNAGERSAGQSIGGSHEQQHQSTIENLRPPSGTTQKRGASSFDGPPPPPLPGPGRPEKRLKVRFDFSDKDAPNDARWQQRVDHGRLLSGQVSKAQQPPGGSSGVQHIPHLIYHGNTLPEDLLPMTSSTTTRHRESSQGRPNLPDSSQLHLFSSPQPQDDPETISQFTATQNHFLRPADVTSSNLIRAPQPRSQGTGGPISIAELRRYANAPAPAVSAEMVFITHITERLKSIADQAKLMKRFKPKRQTRELGQLERGYWSFVIPINDSPEVAAKREVARKDTNSTYDSWSTAHFIRFWLQLSSFIEQGHAGWGTSAEFEPYNPDSRVPSTPSTASTSGSERAASSVADTTVDLESYEFRVSCWGETAAHIWMVMYIFGDRMTRGMNMKWRDGNEKTVVQIL